MTVPYNPVACFISGIVFAASTGTLLYLSEGTNHQTWRTCPPAQNGQELISTTQYEDRTDCFYAKVSKGKNAINRKEIVI